MYNYVQLCYLLISCVLTDSPWWNLKNRTDRNIYFLVCRTLKCFKEQFGRKKSILGKMKDVGSEMEFTAQSTSNHWIKLTHFFYCVIHSWCPWLNNMMNIHLFRQQWNLRVTMSDLLSTFQVFQSPQLQGSFAKQVTRNPGTSGRLPYIWATDSLGCPAVGSIVSSGCGN